MPIWRQRCWRRVEIPSFAVEGCSWPLSFALQSSSRIETTARGRCVHIPLLLRLPCAYDMAHSGARSRVFRSKRSTPTNELCSTCSSISCSFRPSSLSTVSFAFAGLPSVLRVFMRSASGTGRLEKLANDHAAKHGSRREEEPTSPISPVSSPPRLPLPSRSASEYISAPSLGSDMHATLPTPLLGEMRPPSSLSTPPKSRATNWCQRHSDRLTASSSARPTLNRSCKTAANVASWLASASAAPDTMA